MLSTIGPLLDADAPGARFTTVTWNVLSTESGADGPSPVSVPRTVTSPARLSAAETVRTEPVNEALRPAGADTTVKLAAEAAVSKSCHAPPTSKLAPEPSPKLTGEIVSSDGASLTGATLNVIVLTSLSFAASQLRLGGRQPVGSPPSTTL